jgi:hypothetical protein
MYLCTRAMPWPAWKSCARPARKFWDVACEVPDQHQGFLQSE